MRLVHSIIWLTDWMDVMVCECCVLCASVFDCAVHPNTVKKSISVQIFNLTWHDIPFHITVCTRSRALALSAPCVMRTICTHAPDSTVRKFQRHRTSFCVYACVLLDGCMRLHGTPALRKCCAIAWCAWEKNTIADGISSSPVLFIPIYLSGVCVLFVSALLWWRPIDWLRSRWGAKIMEIWICATIHNAPLTGIIWSDASNERARVPAHTTHTRILLQ